MRAALELTVIALGKAPRAMREWAQKLEAKAKYVVSGSRSDFPWQNTIKVEGDLREAISALKAKTARGVLVGAPKLSAALGGMSKSAPSAPRGQVYVVILEPRPTSR